MEWVELQRGSGPRTSFLLLQRQLGPVDLHAITQGHPQLGLLLRRHGLPALLDTGQRRAGDGVGVADLRAVSSRSYDGSRAAEDGLAEHCGGRRGVGGARNREEG
jgi:hypothetical protein